jgi:hypothetical protein
MISRTATSISSVEHIINLNKPVIKVVYIYVKLNFELNLANYHKSLKLTSEMSPLKMSGHFRFD